MTKKYFFSPRVILPTYKYMEFHSKQRFKRFKSKYYGVVGDSYLLVLSFVLSLGENEPTFGLIRFRISTIPLLFLLERAVYNSRLLELWIKDQHHCHGWIWVGREVEEGGQKSEVIA